MQASICASAHECVRIAHINANKVKYCVCGCPPTTPTVADKGAKFALKTQEI